MSHWAMRLELHFCLFVCSFSRQSFSITLITVLDSPGRPGWPLIHRDPPLSVTQVLGLKVSPTTTGLLLCFSCNASGSGMWIETKYSRPEKLDIHPNCSPLSSIQNVRLCFGKCWWAISRRLMYFIGENI